jgi:hypothetical protein
MTEIEHVSGKAKSIFLCMMFVFVFLIWILLSLAPNKMTIIAVPAEGEDDILY